MRTMFEQRVGEHMPPPSLIEIEVGVRLLDIGLVALVKVLGQYDVAVFAHGVHAGLLADRSNLGIADLIGPRHIVLQVHLLAQVHAGGAGLHSPLQPAVMLWT